MMTKFRSGFEQQFKRAIPNTINLEYEQVKLKYVQPESHHTYTPDFHLPGTNIYFELKGIWDGQDRQKHLLIKQQHPDKRIILVFQKPNLTISKSSKTTYAQWADKHSIERMTTEEAIKFIISTQQPALSPTKSTR